MVVFRFGQILAAALLMDLLKFDALAILGFEVQWNVKHG
jgi:hypothetical protein